MKHTPGPWKVIPILDRNYNETVAIQSDNGDLITGEDVIVGAMPLLPETEANAALISSAPDLLEALKGCLPSIKADAEASHLLDGFNTKRNRQDEFLEFVEAAIAKADGR